jgi:adenylate cyclase
VAISGAVREYIVGRIDEEFRDGGRRELKNIGRPINVWLWLPEGASGPTAAALALPDKPSIAVLPFDNMSGDPDQEYFSDGISEDLTTALSRFDWLFVIGRNSAFTYKGKVIDLKRVGRELGVRYVLEGSVRRAGGRVRINAQLVEAEADRHVWAERFDRQMEDVFELQDDIVASIASTVGPEITFAEIERARAKRPDILDAWDHYLRALAVYHRMTKDDMDTAISHLEKAIEVESELANAHALLGLCHAHLHSSVVTMSQKHSVTQSIQNGPRALIPDKQYTSVGHGANDQSGSSLRVNLDVHQLGVCEQDWRRAS